MTKKKVLEVHQGKSFSVTLQSMLGSTNYGWCVMAMPEGIALCSTEVTPLESDIGPVHQTFYFLALESFGEKKIHFALLCLSDPSKVSDDISIDVTVISYNEEGQQKFLKYSENAAIYEPTSLCYL